MIEKQAEKPRIPEDLRKKIEPLLLQIQEVYFPDILDINGTYQCCAYSASILTCLLQELLPEHDVRIGFMIIEYKNNNYSPPQIVNHFLTEVDDEIVIDATWGQFDPKFENRIIYYPIDKIDPKVATRFNRASPCAFWQNLPYLSGDYNVTLEELTNNPNSPIVPGMSYMKWDKVEKMIRILENLRKKYDLNGNCGSPFDQLKKKLNEERLMQFKTHYDYIKQFLYDNSIPKSVYDTIKAFLEKYRDIQTVNKEVLNEVIGLSNYLEEIFLGEY